MRMPRKRMHFVHKRPLPPPPPILPAKLLFQKSIESFALKKETKQSNSYGEENKIRLLKFS
jgi:hypothetical protein